MTRQIHHLITLACNKACPYCINDLKEFGDSTNKRHASLEAIESYYVDAAKQHNGIRISGGEPSKFKRFREISVLAHQHFSHVELNTANTDILSAAFDWIDQEYTVIYFSLHEPYIGEFFTEDGGFFLKSQRAIPVILSCLTDLYERMLGAYAQQPERLMEAMRENGFNGFTVRQEWPAGIPLRSSLPTYADFSTRYNPKEQCESQVLLMPDLSIIDNTMKTTEIKEPTA